MIYNKIPVAFFVYNRPEHTLHALKSLAACNDLDKFSFYFFSDGARDVKDEKLVNEVRRLLDINAPVFSAKILKKDRNLGLSRSIVEGVNGLCDSYGCAVVLEDDLIVSPDFLRYMAASLNYYAINTKVMQVGAYTIAPPTNCNTDAFFLPVTTTWGWGTWARAWRKFSWHADGWPDTLGDEEWLSLFQIGGAANYVSMLEDRLAGRNDSWGILWWYAVSRCRGQVLYPRQSLVWNGGFDGSGIHCGKGSVLGQGPMPESWFMLPKTISFPASDHYHQHNFQLLQDLMFKQSGIQARVNSRSQFLLNSILQKVKLAFS